MGDRKRKARVDEETEDSKERRRSSRIIALEERRREKEEMKKALALMRKNQANARNNNELSESSDDDDDDGSDDDGPNQKGHRGKALHQPNKGGQQAAHSGSTSKIIVRSPIPTNGMIEKIIRELERHDSHDIFALPASSNERGENNNSVIKQPMDFATMLTKMYDGSYTSFDLVKRDALLMCNNAMLANPDENSIPHKVAKTIIAHTNRIFERISVEPEPEPEPEPQAQAQPQHSDLELSPGNNRSTRRKQPDNRTRTSRNARASSKHAGKNKSVMSEADRRDTYLSPAQTSNPSIFTEFLQENQPGIHLSQAASNYKESLRRFAEDLGPIAKRFAERKIEALELQQLTNDNIGSSAPQTLNRPLPTYIDSSAPPSLSRPLPNIGSSAPPSLSRPLPNIGSSAPPSLSRPLLNIGSSAPPSVNRPLPHIDSSAPPSVNRPLPNIGSSAPPLHNRPLPSVGSSAAPSLNRPLPNIGSSVPAWHNRPLPNIGSHAPPSQNRPLLSSARPLLDRPLPNVGSSAPPSHNRLLPNIGPSAPPPQNRPLPAQENTSVNTNAAVGANITGAPYLANTTSNWNAVAAALLAKSFFKDEDMIGRSINSGFESSNARSGTLGIGNAIPFQEGSSRNHQQQSQAPNAINGRTTRPVSAVVLPTLVVPRAESVAGNISGSWPSMTQQTMPQSNLLGTPILPRNQQMLMHSVPMQGINNNSLGMQNVVMPQHVAPHFANEPDTSLYSLATPCEPGSFQALLGTIDDNNSPHPTQQNQQQQVMLQPAPYISSPLAAATNQMFQPRLPMHLLNQINLHAPSFYLQKHLASSSSSTPQAPSGSAMVGGGAASTAQTGEASASQPGRDDKGKQPNLSLRL